MEVIVRNLTCNSFKIRIRITRRNTNGLNDVRSPHIKVLTFRPWLNGDLLMPFFSIYEQYNLSHLVPDHWNQCFHLGHFVGPRVQEDYQAQDLELHRSSLSTSPVPLSPVAPNSGTLSSHRSDVEHGLQPVEAFLEDRRLRWWSVHCDRQSQEVVVEIVHDCD